MGSIVLNVDHIEMMGAVNPDAVYSSRAPSQPLETPSRSTTSASDTPTSTAPPSVGSARLPVHANDVPAYINYTPSQASTRASSTPTFTPRPPSMTSHPTHANPPDPYSTRTPPTHQSHSARAEAIEGNSYSSNQSTPDSPRLQPTYRSMQSVPGSEANSPSRIRVQSLSHIQSLASEDILGPRSSHTPGTGSQHRKYEISSMPVTEIIEMVAGLLTKITTTNDMHHEHVHRHIPPPEGTSNLSPQATSVLAFHGKNVPSITILSYLTRIHKYCPTTYEVFLSLLVYFDRMTELVNRGQLDHLHQRWDPAGDSDLSSTSTETPRAHQTQDYHMATPPRSTGLPAQDSQGSSASISPALSPQSDAEALSHFFVVDSFNIHRLVIAAVTCASKFFSDVFYTNSRYAKVGGLPLVELNHLELQFLLLNDFRLAITVEELESYGTMLVEFYAREIVTQQQQQQQHHRGLPRSIDPPADAYSDAMHIRSHDKPRGHAEFGQTPTPP